MFLNYIMKYFSTTKVYPFIISSITLPDLKRLIVFLLHMCFKFRYF